ncbi:MAG: HD domain-containing phosphohydrolase [Candidatus Sericytochromatia bacterium]|nr:HD domain-containing phosphohydrolase [Candidatus Sericytochromatia bacterium]
MSDELIAPGKRLEKPLLHPTTGNVLLPAGTVLSGPYIDRLTRQGLLPQLRECMEGFDPDKQEGSGLRLRDLDGFEIEIPDLPAILFEFLPRATPPAAAPPVAATASSLAAEALPPPPPGEAQPATTTELPLPPISPALPLPETVSGLPLLEEAAPALLQRYHHNPRHVLSERGLLSAMLTVDQIDEQLRHGKLPSYPPLAGVVQEVIARLQANQGALADGLELRIVDQPHHRSHPVNVMTLSIAIGIALAYDNKTLFTLGIAALCHDIGKAAIAPEVLNKVGALTPQDVELLRAHPLIGKRIMEKITWATPEMARIVYEHHERNHGGGYPLHLKGAQIHDSAKIIAVAEVYDALISDTSYRARYNPEFAYVTVRNGERMGLDPVVLKAFTRFVYPYPVNAYVVLEDRRIGQVVQNNRPDPLRPIVRVKEDLINLMDVPEIKIKDIHVQAFR